MHAHRTIAGRFVLNREVGAGGMATVYLADDQRDGGRVAVKILRLASPHSARRFNREAELLAELAHPAIVRYVAHGTTPGGTFWLAMEWLDGADLADRLRAGPPLSVGESVTIARRTASALALAHARGLVHRDIKPSNLFLPAGDPARVKLLDFGIARVLDGARLTRTGMLVGTPRYMAPEQARGESVDARADVFALGSVLFECLCARPAFEGHSETAVFARILFDQPPHIRDHRPELSPALDALVHRMLTRDPAGRPADASEVLASLDRITSDGPGTSSPLEGLTGRERRVVSLVLGRPPRPDAGPGADDPTASIDAFRPLHQTVSRLSRDHDGSLEYLLDGSFLIVLDGPGLPADRALSATRCAAALRGALPDVALIVATGRAAAGADLQVGDLVEGAIADLDADPAGAHRAVLLDTLTASLLDARFDLEPGPRAARLGPVRQPLHLASSLLGRATECVGREPELALLDGLVRAVASERHARVALVTAPAGIGKSRLTTELVRRLQARQADIELLVGRGDPLGTGSPFALLASALRGRADAPDLARDGSELHADRVQTAWLAWLRRTCARRPTLLILEDVHWADHPSLDLVDASLDRLHDAPLLVLALARPEVHTTSPGLWASREPVEVRLAGLPRSACEQLARYCGTQKYPHCR